MSVLSSKSVQNSVAVVVISLLSIAIFSRALSVGYMSDDFDWLVVVESGNTAFEPMATAGTGTYFRPLITWSFRATHHLVPDNPALVHRATNLLIHWINGITLYWTVLLISRRWFPSLALALLFLVHPSAVPNIYYLASRVDSLMALGYLIGVLGFVKFLLGNRRLWLLVSGAGLVASLLSKEMGVTLFISLTVIFILFRRWGKSRESRNQNSDAWSKGALVCFFLLTVGYLVTLWFTIYREGTPGIFTTTPLDLLERLIASFVLLLFPNSIAVLLEEFYLTNSWLLFVAPVLLLLTAILIWFGLVRRGKGETVPLIVTLLALYFSSLIPLLVVGVSSRRMYLPVAMLCVALSFLSWSQPRSGNIFIGAAYALVFLFIGGALVQGSVWLRNWWLVESHCDSFRAEMVNAPPDSPVVLLTFPASFQNVAVFSNDVNGALFFCLNGRPGYFSQINHFGNLTNIRDSKVGAISVVSSEPDTVTVSADDADTFFAWPEAMAGDNYSRPNWEVHVDAAAQPGRVDSFTVRFSDHAWLAEAFVFYSDGIHFQRASLESIPE